MKFNRALADKLSFQVVLLYAYAVLASFLVFNGRMPGLFAILALVPLLRLPVVMAYGVPRRMSLDFKLVALLLACCYAALFLQWAFTPDYVDFRGRSITEFSTLMLAGNSLWLLAGLAISNARYERSDIISLGLIAVALVMLIPNLGDGMVIVYSTLLESGGDSVNHLIVAEMFVVLVFAAFSFASGLGRWLVIPCAAFLLFAAGGRSSFYLGILAILLAQFVMASYKERVVLLVFVGLFATWAGAFLLQADDSLVERMLFSSGVDEDGSFQEREGLYRVGLSLLPEQILFGGPALYARENRSVGSYIHNLLSVWQFFGLIPFLLMSAMLGRALMRVRAEFIRFKDDVIYKFGALLCVYVSLSVAVSKSVGFPLLWLALGFWGGRALALRRGGGH